MYPLPTKKDPLRRGTAATVCVVRGCRRELRVCRSREAGDCFGELSPAVAVEVAAGLDWTRTAAISGWVQSG